MRKEACWCHFWMDGGGENVLQSIAKNAAVFDFADFFYPAAILIAVIALRNFYPD